MPFIVSGASLMIIISKLMVVIPEGKLVQYVFLCTYCTCAYALAQTRTLYSQARSTFFFYPPCPFPGQACTVCCSVFSYHKEIVSLCPSHNSEQRFPIKCTFTSLSVVHLVQNEDSIVFIVPSGPSRLSLSLSLRVSLFPL